MTTILEVRGLTVQFGAVRAVDDVTFDLAKGEILGVIGPNGAGKTTMFDAISGFVSARGRISLDGNDISGASPATRSRAGLGRSFQDAKLFPSLTVAETLSVAYERHIHAQDVVSTALRLPWVSRAEHKVKGKVDELIELMGLGAFRDKFISELSTGSRRIVDLAVIMAHDPKVLLLDEPSSGIAQRETEALAPLLLRLRDETGASLIVVEHDMPLIQTVSDELLALETGAVLTRGEPATVLDDPRLVAAYLGTDQAAISRSGALTPSSNGERKSSGERRRAPLQKATATNGGGKTTTAKKAPPQRERTAPLTAANKPEPQPEPQPQRERRAPLTAAKKAAPQPEQPEPKAAPRREQRPAPKASPQRMERPARAAPQAVPQRMERAQPVASVAPQRTAAAPQRPARPTATPTGSRPERAAPSSTQDTPRTATPIGNNERRTATPVEQRGPSAATAPKKVTRGDSPAKKKAAAAKKAATSKRAAVKKKAAARKAPAKKKAAAKKTRSQR